MEAVEVEGNDMDAFEDDGGADMHEDMWDSVEVDSEFDDLLDEDVYADLDVDLETIDDKQNPEAFEHEPAPESPSSPARYNRPHHYGLSQHAPNDIHDIHAPAAHGSNQMVNVDEYDDEDDEAEANYATQVERYTQYHQTHHEVSSGSDIDETDDEEDEATLARPARTRRPKKAPSSNNISSSRQRQNLPSSTRARSRKSVKRDTSDEDDSELDDETYGVRSQNRTNRRAARREVAPTVNTAANDLQELSLKLAREYATAIDAKKKELQEIERRIEQTRSLWDRLQNVWVNKVWSESIMAPRVQAAEAFRNAKRAGRPLKHDRLATTRQIKQETEEMETLMRKLDSGAASAAARAISVDAPNGGDVTSPGGPPPKKKKKMGDGQRSRPLYCLTPNRGFVKVVCQDCNRELFGNHLGFLNHCRMVHYVKFASWDDAVELCGTPVDESEVPADDPSRTESSSSMGFSISQKKSEAAKTYQMQRTSHPGPIAPSTPGGFAGGITIDHTKPQGAQGSVKIATPNVHLLPEAVSSATNSVAAAENSRFFIKKQVIIGNSSKRLTKEDLSAEDDAYRALYWPSAMASSASSRNSHGAQSLPTDATGVGLVPTHRWLLSIRAIGEDKLTNYISKVRFYLHPSFSPRNIIDVVNPPFQILRETSQEWPVRLQIFFKDPRNQPMSFTHYIVFQQGALEAVGEEYYADIEIDREYISGMVLDENVSMVSHIGSPSSRTHHSREQQASRYHQYLESNPTVKSEGGQAWIGSPGPHHAEHARHHAPVHVDPHAMAFASGHSGDGPAVPYDTLVDFVRHAATSMFPLIADESASVSTPYSVAKTAAEWTAWSHGKRKSSEWQRALRISQLLVERFQVRRTTREILDLCKHLNLTPVPDDAVPHLNAEGNEPLLPGDPHSPCVAPLSLYSRQYALPLLRSRHERLEMADHTQLIGYIRYCRFCGSVHTPIDRIDDLEIACGEKKLLVLQESHSTFRELLERSIKQVKAANAEQQRHTSKSSSNHAASSSYGYDHHLPHHHAGTSSSAGGGSSSMMNVDKVELHYQSPKTPKRTPQPKQRAASSVNGSAASAGDSNRASTPHSSSAISAAVAQAHSLTPGEKEAASKPTTPARRGRPAKVTKLVGSLLASPVAASTIVTTTPGTLEAPSNATVVYLNPPPDASNGNGNNSTEAAIASGMSAVFTTPIISTDPKTGEIKWDMHVLATMEATAFIEFLKHITVEQIAQLPTLPADRLNLLVEYLNSASASTEAPKSDDVSASTLSSAPTAAAPVAPIAQASSSEALASSAPAVEPKVEASSAAMEVDATPKDSSSAPSDSAWTPAQEAVLLAYYSKHPDALASGDPLPPDVLEALYIAGLPPSDNAAASSTSDANAAPTACITPPVVTVSTPAATPTPRKKKKAAAPIVVASPLPPSHQAAPAVDSSANGLEHSSTPAKPSSSSTHPGTPMGNATFSSSTSSGITVAPETAAEALSHPIYGTLDFKRAERPTAAEVPALHEQLDLLQLDHDTTNHAELLLLKLMTSFARRLLFGAAVAHAAEKAVEPAHESKYKVIVPLHAASAIVNNPINFDFLMDEGLARYTSLEMIQANALAEDPAADLIMEQLKQRLILHRQMTASDAQHHEAHAAAAQTEPHGEGAHEPFAETRTDAHAGPVEADHKPSESNGQSSASTAADPSHAHMHVDEPAAHAPAAQQPSQEPSSHKMDES